MGGLALGTLALYQLRRYCAGGRCSERRDLTGCIAVITGGNAGIGLETAKSLAEAGCEIIFGARDTAKNDKARASLAKTSKANVTCFRLDLSETESID